MFSMWIEWLASKSKWGNKQEGIKTARNDEAPENFNVFRGFGYLNNGGEIGIRTLGTREGTTDFESVPFGHSGISPTARIITAPLPEAKPLGQIFSVLSVGCVDYSGTPRRFATSS
ncbi:hypothetical protein EMIT0324P_10415 [Pseudomonas chlororaphis]